jgi:uncharacterized protein YeaO (DUF488 family)
MIQVKHIYESALEVDGVRVLVDRTWPQGISRFDAKIDHWLKEVAPSTDLRRWFGQLPERWEEFRRRYRLELADNTAVEELRFLIKGRLVTLLYGAPDPERNNAVILARFLRDCPATKTAKGQARPVREPAGHSDLRLRPDSRKWITLTEFWAAAIF